MFIDTRSTRSTRRTLTKPIWISLAQGLVAQAHRDLAKKARLAAQVKPLYTLENRAKLKLKFQKDA